MDEESNPLYLSKEGETTSRGNKENVKNEREGEREGTPNYQKVSKRRTIATMEPIWPIYHFKDKQPSNFINKKGNYYVTLSGGKAL